MEFKFYAAKTSLNNYSVAVYEKNNGNYVLKVEKNGTKVRGTKEVEMTSQEYEALPHDPYNSLVRLQAAMAVCGFGD